jgi:predicted nucleotidyltransferase
MSNTYKINFKQLRQENLKDVFDSFERALSALNIDFYLIGALARDTWFAQKGIHALGTKDIDWAVLVSNEKDFEELKSFLVRNEGFTESTSNEYVLFDKKGVQIDLLPFGAIEIEGNKFIDSEGVVRTDISGFKEVYEEAVEDVTFENRYKFKVSSLPGIVILKLIAFDDRPEARIKDVQDIGLILNHYFELESEHIYENYSDLFEEESTLEIVGARALGRDMQIILNRNKLVKERVLSILSDNTQSLEKSKIGLILVTVLNQRPGSIEEAVNLLMQMVNGIMDKIE